ncbi:MAG TPA: peptide chain release factor 2 [Bacillota bacterium]
MFDDLARRLKQLATRLQELRDSLDPAGRGRRIAELEAAMSQPGFWDDPAAAQRQMRELKSLREPLEACEALLRRSEDAAALVDLAVAEGDLSLEGEIQREVQNLEEAARDLELSVLLNGTYDNDDAILSLHAGAGGTESQDWAQMLMRMYVRWAERKQYQVEVLDYQEGEEAGIKSATLSVRGPQAYGFLKTEKGVHRLVRISPFDASGRRHTSFASVDVLPDLADDADDIEIRPEDLRIDTYRSGGAGGQHVNKTDSAVRITHLPTGIVVTCQNERSQHSNRDTAMKILRARLRKLREEERERELAELRGEQREIAWGSQIRSYVFHPYTLVKDHRTGVEVGNVQAVMDGEIDEFVYAVLEQRAAVHPA